MKKEFGFKIRVINKNDRGWIEKFFRQRWGSEKIVSKGRIYYPNELLGFVAVKNEKRLGLITYHTVKNECQITSLNSIIKRRGAGTALVEKVKKVAKKLRCKRLWLTTTNDNTDALRFYQKRGFSLRAVYPGAVTSARKKLKPEIPLTGDNGIPLKDEIELEIR